MSERLHSSQQSFRTSRLRRYAHMQAIGMVNDHVADCFRHREVGKLGQDRFDGVAMEV